MNPSKSDWKRYQQKIGKWQERYIEKLVLEYADYLRSDLPASVKFWELEKRIKRDKKNPGVLIEVSKSEMLWDIVRLLRIGVISIEDLVDFSEDLKKEVEDKSGLSN
ncbi:multidrug transporter [Clostridiales bacterium COT073_COT-073]|nr:multidrug transporter [Clostridiales bacterium COT073_COT-073]